MAEPTTDAGKAKPGGVQFVIEMAGPRNENFLCPHDRSRVRGRWQRDRNGGGQLGEELLQMPAVPGICFAVDADRRAVRRFDPLGQPQNERLLRKIRRVHRLAFKTDIRPEDAKVWTGMTPNEVKTFVLWCRRQLDLKCCEVHKGAVPEYADIERMPGDFIVGGYDSGPDAARTVKSKDFRYRRPAEPSSDEFGDEPAAAIDFGDGDDE